MKSKLNFLIGMSLKRKVKTKWFVIVNIILALLIIGLINVDSIISLFGGDFNEKTNLYVISETDEIYNTFENQLNNTNNLLNQGTDLKYNIIKADKTKDDIIKLISENDKESNSILLELNNSVENVLDVVITTKEYVDFLDIQVLTTAINNTKTTLAIYRSNISEEELAAIYSPVNIERIYLEENKNSTDENMEMIMTTVFPVVILPFFMLTIFLVQMIGAEVNGDYNIQCFSQNTFLF